MSRTAHAVDAVDRLVTAMTHYEQLAYAALKDADRGLLHHDTYADQFRVLRDDITGALLTVEMYAAAGWMPDDGPDMYVALYHLRGVWAAFDEQVLPRQTMPGGPLLPTQGTAGDWNPLMTHGQLLMMSYPDPDPDPDPGGGGTLMQLLAKNPKPLEALKAEIAAAEQDPDLQLLANQAALYPVIHAFQNEYIAGLHASTPAD